MSGRDFKVGDFVKFRHASNTLWGKITLTDGRYLETELANQPMMPRAGFDEFEPIPGTSVGDQVIVCIDDVLDYLPAQTEPDQ
ncbi:MAG: hypothetical protein AAF583_01440 [Pseudomonadota bacterium]